MPLIPKNNGKPWTEEEIAELLQLIRDKTPMQLMKRHLGRSEAAIVGRLQILKRESSI